MNKISYQKLYKYYTEVEELSVSATLKNIWKIRRLPQEFKIVVAQIISKVIDKQDVSITNMELHGVTLQELVENDGMTRMGAVLFMDWLRREPHEAMEYMRREQFRTPLEPLNDEQLDIVQQAIENLKKAGAKNLPVEEYEDDTLETDIEIEQNNEEIL